MNYVTQTSLKHKIIYHMVSHVFAVLMLNPANNYVETLWRCLKIGCFVKLLRESSLILCLFCALAGAFHWPSPLQPCPWARLAMTHQRCRWAGAGSVLRLLTGSCGCCLPERSGSSWPTSPSRSSTS